MIHGLNPSNLPQWGSFFALLTILAGVVTVFVRGIPERLRAGNERRKIDVAESEIIRTEYTEQIKAFRAEVHDYRNDLHVISLSLAKAESLNRHNESQIGTMLFLIRLLISELKRIAPDSIIIAQAEMTIKQMGHDTPDPSKSASLNAAENVVKTAEITVDEIKQSESEK